MFVFLQVYEHDATVMRPIVAFVSFFRDGAKAFETAPLDISAGWDSKSTAVPIRLTIPLSALAPGTYDCQVTALDPRGGRAAFWRVAITVVP